MCDESVRGFITNATNKITACYRLAASRSICQATCSSGGSRSPGITQLQKAQLFTLTLTADVAVAPGQ